MAKKSENSMVFMVPSKADSNFSIFAVNIISIYRKLKLSENDLSSSVSKLVGNRNVCPDGDFFTFELSTTHSSKPVRVEEMFGQCSQIPGVILEMVIYRARS